MYGVALKMLFGDRVKYLGLVFGVAFATLTSALRPLTARR